MERDPSSDAFRAGAGKSKSPERKPFYSGNRDHRVRVVGAGLRMSMQSGGRGGIAFSNCDSNIRLRYLRRLKFAPYMNALNTSFPCSVSDGELYSATVSDFSGSDPLIYKEPLRTDQSDSKHLNCECHSAITLYVQR